MSGPPGFVVIGGGDRCARPVHVRARAGVTVRSADQQAKKSPGRNAGYCPTPFFRLSPNHCGAWSGSGDADTSMAVAGPRQGRESDPAGNGPTVVGHGIIDDAMLYL